MSSDEQQRYDLGRYIPVDKVTANQEITRQAYETPDAAARMAKLVIQHVVDFGENRFLDEEGGEVHEPYTESDAFRVFDNLRQTFEALGSLPGFYTLEAFNAEFPGTVHDKLRVLEAMPETVALLYLDTRTVTHSIRIGNIAFQSRPATAEELEERRQQQEAKQAEAERAELQKQAARDARAARRREEELSKVEGIIPLTSYDHAIATVGDNSFYIVPDRSGTVIAVRTLQALPSGNKPEYVEGRIVAQAAWENMPRVEREMFLTKEKDVGSNAAPAIIIKHVLAILRSLTKSSGINITRETSGQKFKILNPVTVTLSETPLPKAGRSGLIPVFTHDTPKELRNWDQAAKPASPEATDEATRLLAQEVDSQRPLSQEEAIALLDLITDRDIKNAMRAILLQTSGKRAIHELDEKLDKLRARVMRSLGEGYRSAYLARTIGGNSWSGANSGVYVTGGGLRGDLTKWYVGEDR